MSKKKDKADKAGKPPKKSPAQEMWELLLCLAVAVGIALGIKFLLIEPFMIPTGSMEPTLHGRPDGGDRVLCTKVNYWLRKPRRWEIFVFKYPYEQAILKDRNSVHEEYNGQNFIKRCVGLPGEYLAIAQGDIFTAPRPGGGGSYAPLQKGAWTRQVKSDQVQRGLWIPVYGESFEDVAVEEFLEFWAASGAGAKKTLAVTPGHALAVSAEAPVHLAFTPRLRTGERDAANGGMEKAPAFLAGIPDRYVVRQPLTFACPHCQKPECRACLEAGRRGASRLVCPHCTRHVRKTFWDQKIAARCPHCGAYLLENCVVNYGRRSDLPTVSKICPDDPNERSWISQGEANKSRTIDYHMVGDLRVRARVRPSAELPAEFALEINCAAGLVKACFSPVPPVVRLHLDGAGESLAEAPLALPAGEWQTVELCYVDGEARVFVGDEPGAALLTHAFSLAKPGGDSLLEATGVLCSVIRGRLEIGWLGIDRDVYYYSGRDSTRKERGHSYERLLDHNGVFTEPGYIAMGDNCPSSNDSRAWGPVPDENLRGPAIFVWWPPHRVHALPVPEE